MILGKRSQALYAFPPEIAGTSQLPKSLEEKLDKEHIIISIWQVERKGLLDDQVLGLFL